VLPVLGAVTALLAVYVLVTGRLRWARIRSRRGAAALAAVSMGLFVVAGATDTSERSSTPPPPVERAAVNVTGTRAAALPPAAARSTTSASAPGP